MGGRGKREGFRRGFGADVDEEEDILERMMVAVGGVDLKVDWKFDALVGRERR